MGACVRDMSSVEVLSSSVCAIFKIKPSTVLAPSTLFWIV